MTFSVPLIANPPFALTPPAPAVMPMLEFPDDVKRPLTTTVPLLSAAPFRVNAFRNEELAPTVSEVAAVVLDSTKLLAAVKLWTDCWLFASVTVVPANGVSMHAMSLTPGKRFVFQFAAVVHCPSPPLPVH